jgi:hypothetical protein
MLSITGLATVNVLREKIQENLKKKSGMYTFLMYHGKLMISCILGDKRFFFRSENTYLLMWHYNHYLVKAC